ncbi:perilipin-3-like [Eublepharis macularius]|uniref:Perilipin n=1 Tax=Eublepharis macularius TaxID=481883 RepID=A0AA97JV10_EUBMA|nr:perilipin-3-like [Eublepharis macularius]
MQPSKDFEDSFAMEGENPLTSKATMTDTPEPNTTSSETSEESLQDENILKRVGSLPLVTSVCDLVSANYTSIKRKSSYLQTVCNGAEKSVKSLTGAAVSRVQPILMTFEPQIAAANKYACKSLNAMEEKLPILQQTADQVVFDAKELVSSKVTGAKNAVTCRLSGMVNVTKDAVQGSVKTTSSLVTSSMSVVMGTKMGQMAKNSMDAMLGRSHAFVDHYLLVTDDDMGELQPCRKGEEMDPIQQEQTQIACQGYLACLISLLKKLHTYVSQQSQWHVRHASQSLQRVLENQYLEWKSWLVALYYTITLPLRTIYLIILFTIEELSTRIQENMPQMSYILEDLEMALATLECLQNLCRRIFIRVFVQMLEDENLNALLDYIRNTVPFCFLPNHCKCKT